MLIGLMRVNQWYKNLVVFLPIVFGGQLGNSHALLLTVVGFFALSFVSSAGYIINDIADKKADMRHPEKKSRPIASGRIGVGKALVASGLSLAVGFALAAQLSRVFLCFVLALFGLTQLYTFWLKKEVFADILLIGVNFVLRAVSGAYVIAQGTQPYIWVSPWLVLCPFFLSLFLSSGKRHYELKTLKSLAGVHRKALTMYSPELIEKVTMVSATLLVISYSLFSFLSVNPGLLYSLPFALYVVFRYLALIASGSEVAGRPELAVRDLRLLIGSALWIGSIFVLLYV
jgi:4-hydroxybenzoate polyprenyltransferase